MFSPNSNADQIGKSLSSTLAKSMITSEDVDLLNNKLPPEIGRIRNLPYETNSNIEGVKKNDEKLVLKSVNDLDARIQILEKLLILEKENAPILNAVGAALLAFIAWLGNGFFSPILISYGERFRDKDQI